MSDTIVREEILELLAGEDLPFSVTNFTGRPQSDSSPMNPLLGNGLLENCLMRFLFMDRMTPHASTGVSPA